jgi:membrane-bound serine protease (ClpP class)
MALVLTLLVVGAVLMMLEVYLPGMIAGTVGFLCLLAGVIVGYQEFGVQGGTWVLIGVVAGLIGGFFLWLWVFPRTSMGRAVISRRTIGDVGAERPELVGRSGVAHSQLRPSGTAVIDGHRVDVVTEGALVPKGTPVRVVAVEGMRVVVRAEEKV